MVEDRRKLKVGDRVRIYSMDQDDMATVTEVFVTKNVRVEYDRGGMCIVDIYPNKYGQGAVKDNSRYEDKNKR